MANPLLNFTTLPKFSEIKTEHVLPALNEVLTHARTQTKKLLETHPVTFDNFCAPLGEINEKISRMFGPVSHLNAVVNSPELRDAYTAALPLLSEYSTEMKQNPEIFKKYAEIKNGAEYSKLDTAQKKIVDDALRDFKLAGIDLSDDKKKIYKEIVSKLSQICSKYSDHVLDDTNEFELLITDKNELKGLPESVLAATHQRAVQDGKGKEGENIWKITLEAPSLIPVMKYAENDALRQKLYTANITRATKGERDNTPLMHEILKLRKELAELVGFKNYAGYSLATKMAKSEKEVFEFLEALALKSKSKAKKDLEEVKEFKKALTGRNDDLTPWDFGYYSEKLRQKNFDYSDEELKKYFPEPKVLKGLFEIIERLYGFKVTESKTDTWHKDVRFYDLKDKQNNLQGQLFMDLYARPNKRGGAWMDECIARKKINNKVQAPVAYINCNFSGPIGNDPALFTYDDVRTLFHETGHALHHVLTKVDYLDVSGINGVPWDGVELPSQFFENWINEKESLDLFASHYQTGEKIPNSLYQKMKAARNFMSGYQMMRQLAFALFDMHLHTDFDLGGKKTINQLVKEIWEETGMLPQPEIARFENSFSHIFAGGYAAGYYSYKWAEVLSSDAFSKFEEKGIFDQATGKEFLEKLLSRGGSDDFLKMFIEFRGRKPSLEPLLKHAGIKN